MSYLQMLSPSQGSQGSLYQQCEQQDFCQGAKVIKSPNPVFSTPTNSSVFSEHIIDDWNIQESPLAYNEFEAFSNVLLPENGAFVPEDLFQGGSFGPDDLFQGLEELDKDFQPITNIQQQDSQPLSFGEIEPEKPKLTLKLKKVKFTKRQKSTANSANIPTFQIVQSSLPAETATIFPDGRNQNEFSAETATIFPDGISQNEFSILNAGYISPPFSRAVPSASPIAPSPELTLKDVLKLEDADVIIESSLSTYTNQSPLSSEDEIHSRSPIDMGANRESSFWDNEDPSNCILWSPTSSSEECIYASSSSSPITEHLYQSTSTSPIPYSTINYTDVATTPTPSPHQETTSTKRAKKPRLSQESRKIRKKEQNKQAALRYRMKKKQEDQKLMNAVNQEEEERNRLEKQYSSLRQEISFTKKLMRETLIARKLVPPNAFD